MIKKFLKKYKNNTAYVYEEQGSYSYLTFQQLHEQIKSNEFILNNKNIKLVLLISNNSISSILLYLSCLYYKKAVMLIDEKSDPSLIKNIILTYKPTLFCCPMKHERYYLDLNLHVTNIFKDYFLVYSDQRTCVHDQLRVLLSTSGSTGSQKFVRLSEKNILSNATSIKSYLHILETDRAITNLPLSYSYGLSIINSYLISGASVVITDELIVSRKFWDIFNKTGVTSLSGVPYTYKILKDLKFDRMDLPSLKTMTQAGGRLNPTDIEWFHCACQNKNIKLYIMYGQTEATARISYVPPDQLHRKIGSIGIPIPGGKLRVNKKATKEYPAELIYYGKNVMLGYSEGSGNLSLGPSMAGRLETGDLGYMDSDGYFYITGRSKRFAKLAGFRINLDELEKSLEENFGGEVACSYEDDTYIKVYFTSKSLEEDKAYSYISNTFNINTSFIQVKRIDSLPKTVNGKKNYMELSHL